MTYSEDSITFPPLPTTKTFKNIDAGSQFGRLTVLGFAGSHETSRYSMWWCKCLCGTIIRTGGYMLRSGVTRSCGCWNAAVVSITKRTHGRSKTRIYSSWVNMWTRCTNRNSDDYLRYGGRGITVCDRWKSFENFAMDMGERPPNTTLNRIDNNGNYTPENCEWANTEIQNNNRRSTRLITFQDKTQSITQWMKEFGLPQWTFHNYQKRRNLTDTETLTLLGGRASLG